MFYEKVMIGSSAINHHNQNILNRIAKDVDYLSMEEMKDFSNGDIIRGQGILDKYDFSGEIANLDEIYTLKVSHSFWIIGSEGIWMKHIKDISLLQKHGAVIIPELYSIAYKEWENRHGKKNIDLNKDKDEFFTSGVRRKYVHDSIHASVAFYDQPMFTKILVDNAEVQTSKKKFESLPFEDKIKLVNEECFVLSLERDLIPKETDFIDKADMYKSYMRQLRLLVTQYSKGYFPQWIIENFQYVYRPPLNYWEKFQNSNKKILI